MSAKQLKRELEIIERALNVEPDEPKTMLDLQAMTEDERIIVRGATAITRGAIRRAIKEQNVRTIDDVNIDKVEMTDEDREIIDAYNIIAEKYLITRREYDRRYPIH